MARLFSARTLILGGLAAGAAYALRNNPTVKGLLGGGDGPAAPEPYNPNSPAPSPAPPVANVDVAGPPENTATHVPAPEPAVHDPSGGIDEAAEEAAAAAEAANIGGTPEEYPREDDPTLPVDEAMRPLEEAGGGTSEGQELAELDLVENVESEGAAEIEVRESEIDEELPALEEAPPPSGQPVDAPPPTASPGGTGSTGTTSAEEKSANVWRLDDQPTEEQPKVQEEDSA